MAYVPDTYKKCKELGYLGDPDIKRDGITLNYTQEQVAEYIKCSQDPIYFIKTYMKVIHIDHGLIPFNLYDYQERMIDNLYKHRFNIFLCSRQVGKSTSVIGFYVWKALFHSDKTIGVLANKGAVARELLGKVYLALKHIPYYLQPGCTAVNKGNIDFSNNTRILAGSTSSSSMRGFAFSDILMDEFAFVHKAEDFYESTYPVVSSGKTSTITIVSTLNGPANLFYSLYEGAVQGTNDYVPFRVDWHEVPGRDEAWKEQTVRNIGKERFDQEYGNLVRSSKGSLISGDILISLRKEDPIRVIREKLNVYENPEEGAQYIMCVDVSQGRGQDYSTFNVIKIEADQFTQVATFRDNLISPLMFPETIVKVAEWYNEALVLIESNDAGQVVCNGVYYEFEYENMFVESMTKSSGLGVRMTQKVKRIGCSNLKDIIESRKFKISDKETIKELSNFVAKGRSYEADGNGHDDLVMNLVLFAYFVSTDMFQDLNDVDLRKMLRDEREQFNEEDLPPMGFIVSDNYNVPVNPIHEFGEFSS